jgi:hypothetical protein
LPRRKQNDFRCHPSRVSHRSTLNIRCSTFNIINSGVKKSRCQEQALLRQFASLVPTKKGVEREARTRRINKNKNPAFAWPVRWRSGQIRCSAFNILLISNIEQRIMK